MTDYAKLTDREIDALVAERVMGWVKTWYGWMDTQNSWNYVQYFTPTTAWGDMRLVVERMEGLGYLYLMGHTESTCKYSADFGKPGAKTKRTDADTQGRAVCEAALKVVEE